MRPVGSRARRGSQLDKGTVGPRGVTAVGPRGVGGFGANQDRGAVEECHGRRCTRWRRPLVSGEELAGLATTVGLPQPVLPRLIERWVRDGDDGVACLQRAEADRNHLPDNAAYGQARAFLDEGGRRSLMGAVAGRANTAARATLDSLGRSHFDVGRSRSASVVRSGVGRPRR